MNYQKYNIQDEELAKDLQITWEQLYNLAINKNNELVDVKEQFVNILHADVEPFVKSVNELIELFETNGPGVVGENLDVGLKLMDEFEEKIKNFEKRRIELIEAEKLFDVPVTDYTTFDKMQEDFQNYKLIYELYIEQKACRESWGQTLWVDLNPQLLVDGIEKFLKKFRKFPKHVKELAIGHNLETKMKYFREMVPLMVSLKHEALRTRHWEELMQKTNQFFNMDEDKFTLDNMFSMELHKYENIVEEIIAKAIKELNIEKTIKDTEETWDSLEFTVIKFFKGTEDRGYVLGAVDEIIQILEDNSMNLQSMSSSQFVGPLLPTVQKWEKQLSNIYEVIEQWVSVQQKWIYLESIFIGTDIRSQLPEESENFDQIDDQFRKIMMEAIEDPKVITCCNANDRLSNLINLSEGLEKCQKSLNDYLDSKRRKFPRFYFISTDELLSILGGIGPQCIQEHIIKMFDNIKALRLETNQFDQVVVTAMISAEEEIMAFRSEVLTEGRIEDWMNDVVKEMRQSNRFLTKKAIYDYGKTTRPRTDWILDYQGMMCLASK